MLNKVMLIGNLGVDPELKYTQNGTAVANFTVVTSRRRKDKNGQQQEDSEWHRVIAWQRLGEICHEYLHKGSKVYVEGRLQTRKWQDPNGNDRYTTEIVASDVQFLTPRGRDEGNSQGQYRSGNQGQQSGSNNQGQQGGGYNQGNAGYQQQRGTGDDVPF